MADKDFYTIKNRDFSEQLAPSRVNRFLRKDIDRRESLPFSIGEGARLKDTTSVNFFANSLAGNFSTVIPLDLTSTPLVLVWHMGNKDKDLVVSQGGGTVPGSNYDTGIVLNGCEIFSGAIANYSADKDNLTIKITSTNVGWPVFIDAHFYYVVYYDVTGLGDIGL